VLFLELLLFLGFVLLGFERNPALFHSTVDAAKLRKRNETSKSFTEKVASLAYFPTSALRPMVLLLKESVLCG